MRSLFAKALAVAILPLVLVSCGSSEETQTTKAPKDVAAYKTLFKETFQNYQTAATDIPKKWLFDFELTTNVDWDGKKIESFAGKTFWEAFQSLSARFYGDYDFTDLDKASLATNIKAYLNKWNTGLGDLDLETSIDSKGSLVYEVHNLDPRFLEFFKIDAETSEALVKTVERNKWQKQVTELGTNLLKEAIASFKEAGKWSPLYENSKEEERKIIEAFVRTESVEVFSGSWLNDSTERIAFRFNPENFAKFLGETGKILGNGNENKDFSGDAKTLWETVRIEWTMDIRDKRIVDSDIKLVLRLGWIDEKTWEKKSDDLVAKIRMSFPNPSRLDFDLDTQLYSNSTPDNVLRLRFKWLIK